ncbi:MAG: hypothetical protein NDI94_05915 [Candidatus Woesearchaeota archaeon]|nr:hypothetical protein [Candidatus Woesearchaeota archaeon]
MATRESSDEFYILNLCDEILHEKSIRQHRFDFLLGDLGKNGRRIKLPVDAYYPNLNLVVEYKERQHDESVPFFDKKNRLTASGVHRGKQRELYDQRRRDELRKHKINLIEISCGLFYIDSRKRLIRDNADGKNKLQKILLPYIRK